MKYATDHDFAALDAIRDAVNSVALPKLHSTGVDGSSLDTDNDLFRKIAELRAYSAARSSLVSAMIKTGALERAFAGFDVEKTVQLEEESVLRRYWDEIKAIRFKHKVGEILQAGKAIAAIGREFGSFNSYLRSWDCVL